MISRKTFIEWVKGLNEQQDIELDYYGEYPYSEIFSSRLSSIQFVILDEVMCEGAGERVTWWLFDKAHQQDIPFCENEVGELYDRISTRFCLGKDSSPFFN